MLLCRLVPTSDWRERRPASANPTAYGNDSCSQTGELPTKVRHCESAPSADDDYCSLGCECTGACGCALACGDGSVGTGLRIGVAIGRGGGVLGRMFCSEALAIKRDICSWLALSSATAALSRTICSWLVLSCSTRCSMFARSRAIVWSHCASSGDIGAAVGATSCGVV